MTSTDVLNNNGVTFPDLQSANNGLYAAITASRACYDQIVDNPDGDLACLDSVTTHDPVAKQACADPKWKNSYYCACVNAPVAFPECVYSPCQYENYAFMDTDMLTTVNNKMKYCPNHISCEDVVTLDGTSNIFDNYKSIINCGGANVISPGATAPTGVGSLLMDSPGMLLVLFILVVSVAILIALTFLPKIAQPRTRKDKHGGE